MEGESAQHNSLLIYVTYSVFVTLELDDGGNIETRRCIFMWKRICTTDERMISSRSED